MKATVEISDSLFRKVKTYAARHGMSLSEVLELGLRMAVEGKPPAKRRFRLKTITTKGEGVQSDAGWSTIRSITYGDRYKRPQGMTERTGEPKTRNGVPLFTSRLGAKKPDFDLVNKLRDSD